jgi:tellurite resistance protein TerC
MLALDLGVFHRKSHEVKVKEAIIWSIVWIVLALTFNLGIYLFVGSRPAIEFFTGYLIEKSLSVDNIFVFLLIFSYFQVDRRYQHKVLFYGIIGALIMRAVFIFTGVTLIEKFHWIIYVFGALLVFTGLKMLFRKNKVIHPEKNPLVRLSRKLMPISPTYVGDSFFVRINGRFFATPLFVVLLVVETTDLIFAVDSIPAILAVTLDPFIVYTSNVFAILGLRSLFFALSGTLHLFRYIHYGLSAILVFIGVKMLLIDIYKIPVPLALGVVAMTLILSVSLSLIHKKDDQ